MSAYEFKMGIYLGELQQPFEQSLATARDLGARYVWCGAHSDNRSLYELADAEIDKAAGQVAAHGLEFFLLDGAGLFKTVHLAELRPGRMLEHEQFREHLAKLERAMEVSARLGIGAVGCSSFAWPAEYTGGKPTWPMRWATRGGIISDGDMAKLVEAFSMFADLAEKHEVDIAFLMMQWNYGNTSRNFRRIVEAVGSRRFKALWCPADSYNCGEADNATAGFENLRPYLLRRARQGPAHPRRIEARIRVRPHRRGRRRLPDHPAQPARQPLRRGPVHRHPLRAGQRLPARGDGDELRQHPPTHRGVAVAASPFGYGLYRTITSTSWMVTLPVRPAGRPSRDTSRTFSPLRGRVSTRSNSSQWFRGLV